ncbi:MAG TPA: HNH endonuclease signature motif containing protein [Candidatus Obscuribacterales bacterium]
MPFMSGGKRDYKKQYEKYDGKPSVVKDRAKRNKARAQMEKEGKVSKGDGKDVDHKKPLKRGGSTSRSNLRVQDRAVNRSVAKTKGNKMKGNG